MITQEEFDACFNKCNGRYHDCARIRELVAARLGIKMNLSQAHHIWDEYSESYAAGWLHLPMDDDELVNIIERWVRDNKEM